jgi:hypothetical protein
MRATLRQVGTVMHSGFPVPLKQRVAMIGLSCLLAISIESARGAADRWPVVDPSTQGKDVVILSGERPVVGHVVVALGDSIPTVIRQSLVPGRDLQSQLHRSMPSLIVPDPVRFTYSDPEDGFVIPEAMFVKLSRRNRSPDGEPELIRSFDDLKVNSIGIRKVPIYADPAAALDEVARWNEFFGNHEYREVRVAGQVAVPDFLKNAEKQYEGLYRDFPSWTISAWRKGHTGIYVSIQRSPNPLKASEVEYGYNIGIHIVDTRTFTMWRELSKAGEEGGAP